MPSSSHTVRALRPFLDRHPEIKSALRGADLQVERLRHTIAGRFPSVIRPQPRQLTVAVTAYCNLRCLGCHYGRDYMVGHQLSLATMKEILEDARDAGVIKVRLYGGEPLLHPDLPEIVEHSTKLGLYTYVTSNGIRLKDRIDELYAAGLRFITIGFYGTGAKYDAYTQRRDHFRRLEESLLAVRDRYRDGIELQLNFVLMRSSCNLVDLEEAWQFAERYNMFFHIDLVSFSAPFFTDGPDKDLQFCDEDRPRIEAITTALLRLKQARPSRVLHSKEFIRSIPDWLLKRSGMRVPCDAYQLIWIGADGTVQLCDITLKLGNVKEHRLRDILFGEAHRKAARDAFQLNCPNCMCNVENRIQKHWPSVRRYGGE